MEDTHAVLSRVRARQPRLLEACELGLFCGERAFGVVDDLGEREPRRIDVAHVRGVFFGGEDGRRPCYEGAGGFEFAGKF